MRGNSRNACEKLRPSTRADAAFASSAAHAAASIVLQNGESFVERHPGLEQMRQLFGEDQQLGVRNLQVLRRLAAAWLPFAPATACGPPDRFNSDRNVLQLLDLADGHGAVRAIQACPQPDHPANCGRDKKTVA